MNGVLERMQALRGDVPVALPGVLLAGTLAMAASFIAGQYGGPVMLYALLFGIAFNHLAVDEKTAPGIRFCARGLLRFGVALLGLRIALVEVSGLGWSTLLLVVTAVPLTLTVGWGMGRLLGLRSQHALLSAGAVAICGASAALAISATLSAHPRRDADTLFTVAGVTAFSTLAMLLYPLLAQWLSFDARTAGIFLGATIHDVAQTVGAAHMISEDASQSAVLVKLLRVSMLVPVILAVSLLFNSGATTVSVARRPLLPPFLVAFLALLLLNNLWPLPAVVTQATTGLSAWCILAAVAALGINTSTKELLALGVAPLAAMAGPTLFLAAYAAGWLLLSHSHF